MKITAIKAQVKNPERLSVYVDEKFAFSLNYMQLLDEKLHAGLNIDEARLATLKHLSDFGKAYERALMFAMIRPRSVQEMHDYARRKKWAPEDAEAIVDKLLAKKYLDDRRFARAWIENRALGKKTSQRKLRLELKQKGVSESIITEVLQQANYSDTVALKQLIVKKRKLVRYAQDEQKLVQYLARLGFGFDDIKNALQDE
ncbi:MAG TPA: RecX family transcriptional regulator [Candidatus Saccharimonadales bacterium]|nr:RecX family transcriptional regulator [Candidatus Saccharimonadales bacterium]